MKVLTIGGATTDMFLKYKDASRFNLTTAYENRSFLIFEEGHKINLDELIFHTGGGATNSAVSFKRLGFDVATFCKVGNDKPAEFIIERLKESGVDTGYILRSQHEITGHSLIIPCKDGDRIVLAYRGANTDITAHELPTEALKACDTVYITSLSGQAARLLVPITKMAKDQGALVATNPGTSQLKLGASDIYEALPNIDIFILNSDEACSLMLSMVQRDIELHRRVLEAKLTMHNRSEQKQTSAKLMQAPISFENICFDLRLFCQEILRHGPSIVAVTDGAEGVYVANRDEIIFHPSLPKHIENTLGAGDAFGSCFVAKYAQGASIKDAMLCGILNASSVISQLGAKTGLLNAADLDQAFEQAAKDLFQIFPLY